jgi:DNA-binding transcriptional regulator YiaG
MLAAEDAALEALLKAQAELFEAVAEEHLHEEHSARKIEGMQEHSLGVRIAAGRKGQTASRQAQVAAGLTDQKVADMLKVPRSTVCKWHLGQTRIPAAFADRLVKRGIPRTSWSKIDE